MSFPIYNNTQEKFAYEQKENNNLKNHCVLKKSSKRTSLQRQLSFHDAIETSNNNNLWPFSNNESPRKKAIISPRTSNNDSLDNLFTSPASPRFEQGNRSSLVFENNFTKEDISILKNLNEKVEKKVLKINKRNTETSKNPIHTFDKQMLGVYVKSLCDPKHQKSSPYELLTLQQKDAVDRQLKKNPSLKKYIEHNTCLTLKAMEALTTLGADFNRHIDCVFIYNCDNQPLLASLDPDINLDSSLKLQRIRKWIILFCNHCEINRELRMHLMKKWQEYIKMHEDTDELVQSTVQMFYNSLLKDEDWIGFSDKDRQSLKILGGCMATISQKLYSDPGVAVGNTTRPNGHNSAYKDIQGKKKINIHLNKQNYLNVQVCIEKEVNKNEEYLKLPEFATFPNIRLILTNEVNLELATVNEWESNFTIKLGIERINRMGNEAIPKVYDKKAIANKVIKPLTDLGLTINEVYLYDTINPSSSEIK